MSATVDFFKSVADALEQAERFPHGQQASGEERTIAGQACVSLCDNDRDKARTLWKLIEQDLGGYMPHAAAVALIRATSTTNLVPDVQAPVPS